MKTWNRAGLQACLRCGTSERPHQARGYCLRCYEHVSYAANKEEEHRKRKIKRLRAPMSKAVAAYEREKAWKARNRERALASQAAHYQRNKHRLNRWPIGLDVEVFYAGFWCRGTIAKRINKLKVQVQLRGGTLLDIGLRSKSDIRRCSQ